MLGGRRGNHLSLYCGGPNTFGSDCVSVCVCKCGWKNCIVVVVPGSFRVSPCDWNMGGWGLRRDRLNHKRCLCCLSLFLSLSLSLYLSLSKSLYFCLFLITVSPYLMPPNTHTHTHTHTHTYSLDIPYTAHVMNMEI